MARYGRLLTDAQWEKIRPLLPKRPRARVAADLRPTIAKCWKGFCGFCAAGLAGRICRRNFPRLQRAGEGFGIGKSKGSG